MCIRDRDCGATNVRAMVVDEQGGIVGKASQPNATLPGEENPEFHIWDADRIFRQISECAVKALEGLNAVSYTHLIRGGHPRCKHLPPE